ncbi:MAG TPA: alpha/beta hydrolase [Caulobacteraceae bacterium]|nr:alpha/beta hydrolase [Caulobacteraceae bacterium]
MHAPRLAALLAAALMPLTAFAADSTPPAAPAPDAGLPKSLDEAIAMEAADALPRTAFYDAPATLTGKPGDLIRQEPGDGYALPAGARAVRFLYHSQDAQGRDVVSSGVVLIPAGEAPAGGWPVIAWAHGTSGVARMCAPSLMKDLAYGEEGLMPMLRAGFAIVAPDYHGLGTDGPHQYVNKLAQARDVVFALPAAHAAVPGLSAQWAVVGHSQGGLAAWGVAELERERQDPGYVGAVAIAPGVGLRAIAGRISQASGVAFYLDYLAFGIAARTPGFKPDDTLTGQVLSRYGDIASKGCWLYAYAAFAHDTGPVTLKTGWDQTRAARTFFAESDVAAAPIAGPLLVIAGEADQTVPIAAVRDAAQTACRRKIALTLKTYPGLDHDPTMANSVPDLTSWIRDRMAGKPAADGCGAVG